MKDSKISRNKNTLIIGTLLIIYVCIFSFLLLVPISSKYPSLPSPQIPAVCLEQGANIDGTLVDKNCLPENIAPKDKIRGFPYIWSTTIYNQDMTIFSTAISQTLLYTDISLGASGAILIGLLYIKYKRRQT